MISEQGFQMERRVVLDGTAQQLPGETRENHGKPQDR